MCLQLAFQGADILHSSLSSSFPDGTFCLMLADSMLCLVQLRLQLVQNVGLLFELTLQLRCPAEVGTLVCSGPLLLVTVASLIVECFTITLHSTAEACMNEIKHKTRPGIKKRKTVTAQCVPHKQGVLSYALISKQALAYDVCYAASAEH